MKYQIQYCVPYEGWEIEYFDTPKEVMTWVTDYETKSYKPFGGYTIYKVEEVNLTELEGVLYED